MREKFCGSDNSVCALGCVCGLVRALLTDWAWESVSTVRAVPRTAASPTVFNGSDIFSFPFRSPPLSSLGRWDSGFHSWFQYLEQLG
jgi:hypothetical protein